MKLKKMKVKELIKELEKFNPELNVEMGYTNECADEGCSFMHIDIDEVLLKDKPYIFILMKEED